MFRLTGRWKSLVFALAAMVIALTLLELLAATYFFLEARYWPHIPGPGPIYSAVERQEFMERLVAGDSGNPGGGILLQPDAEAGWTLQPDPADEVLGFRVNSLGLRGGEIGPKSEGDTRLFFLGDSSIYGANCGESQTMPFAAAKDLEAQLGTPVLGINGGIPGYDTWQSLLLVERLLPEIEPDWVVIGNLWSDCYPTGGVLVNAPRVRKSLVGRSNTYRLLKRLLEPLLSPGRVGWFVSREEMLQAGMDDARVTPDDYLSNLRSIARLAQDGGAEVLFLILPAPIDLTGSGAPEIVVVYRNIVRQVAKEFGAPVLDGPKFLAGRAVKLHHFLDQVHPGPELQQLLGVAVARTIFKQISP
jgi:lysophospholipase L1-like esterase